jgi:hypothetical protein
MQERATEGRAWLSHRRCEEPRVADTLGRYRTGPQRFPACAAQGRGKLESGVGVSKQGQPVTDLNPQPVGMP